MSSSLVSESPLVDDNIGEMAVRPVESSHRTHRAHTSRKQMSETTLGAAGISRDFVHPDEEMEMVVILPPDPPASATLLDTDHSGCTTLGCAKAEGSCIVNDMDYDISDSAPLHSCGDLVSLVKEACATYSDSNAYSSDHTIYN